MFASVRYFHSSLTCIYMYYPEIDTSINEKQESPFDIRKTIYDLLMIIVLVRGFIIRVLGLFIVVIANVA